MPGILDNGSLLDMGRMTARLPSAEKRLFAGGDAGAKMNGIEPEA
jgi:hypothetical protein